MVATLAPSVAPAFPAGVEAGRQAFVLEIRPEAILHAAWRMTASGEAVVRSRQGVLYRVLYVGRRSDGPGPDFRDAVLQHPDGTILKGDIEIHVRPSGWRSHGHDTDRRYNGVIFHIASEGDGTVRSAGGASIPLLILSAPKFASLAGAPANATPGSDPGAVPDSGECADRSSWLSRPRPSNGVTPCGSRMRAGVTGDLDRLLPDIAPEEAGDLRFLARSSGFQLSLNSRAADDVLWAAVLECLGYSRNRKGFRQLAERLPWTALAKAGRDLAPAPADLELVLLWAARLAARPPAGAVAGQFTGLLGELSSTRPGWVRAAGRPYNRPAARIAAAGVLAHRWLSSGPKRALEELVMHASRPAELSRSLTVNGPRTGDRALLGPGRAAEIVVNAVLPALHAIALLEQRWVLAERTLALYRTHPKLPENGIEREVRRMFARAGRPAPAANARSQQGLLYLYRTLTLMPCQTS